MNQFQLLKALMSNSADNAERQPDYMQDQYQLPLDQRIQDIKGMARNPQYKEIPVMEKEEGASNDMWYAPDELIAGGVAPSIQQGLKKGAPVAFKALKSMAQDAPGILANEAGSVGKKIIELKPTQIPQLKFTRLVSNDPDLGPMVRINATLPNGEDVISARLWPGNHPNKEALNQLIDPVDQIPENMYVQPTVNPDYDREILIDQLHKYINSISDKKIIPRRAKPPTETIEEKVLPLFEKKLLK